MQGPIRIDQQVLIRIDLDAKLFIFARSGRMAFRCTLKVMFEALTPIACTIFEAIAPNESLS